MHNKFYRLSLLTYIPALLFCMGIVSCGGDDDDTSDQETKTPVTTKTSTLRCTISTKGMYDTFGIADDVLNTQLANSLATIRAVTYIYDSSGKYVTYKTATAKDFSDITYDIDGISDGSYTLVTIEFLIGSSRHPFTVDGTSTLSTLKLTPPEDATNKYDAVGVSTSTVTVSGNQEVAISPTAIGSIINFHYLGWGESTYETIGIATTKVLKSYSLNPAKTESDRYTIASLQSGYIDLKSSLTISPSVEELTDNIYVLEKSLDWMLCVQEASGINSGTYLCSGSKSSDIEDGKEYYCGIRYAKTSNGFRYHFGDKASYDQWVNGVKTFHEPCLTWGTTVATVNSYMTSLGNYSIYIGSATSAQSTTLNNYYYLGYYGVESESSILYVFYSATSYLLGCCSYYDANDVGEDEILAYLNDKYTFHTQTDTTYEFITKDKNTYIVLEEYEDTWLLMYEPYANKSAMSAVQARLRQQILAQRKPVASFLRRAKRN